MYPDRFVLLQTQKQPELQPDSPIYVHCTRRCRDKSSDAAFLQVRLVNRSDSTVETVILTAEGLDKGDNPVYTLKNLIMAQCHASRRSVFGEGRIFAIDPTPVERVRITVERVAFADGMVWRRLGQQPLIPQEQTLWKTCKCGMRNPPQQSNCELCGRAFVQPLKTLDQMPVPEAEDFPEIRVPCPPQPLVFQEAEESGEEAPVQSPPQQEKTGGFSVFLCILCLLILLAVVAFSVYCVLQYRQNIL